MIRPSRPIPILTYHQIAEAPARGAPFRGLYVSPAAFKRQMVWLKRLGWTGLSVSALMPYLRGERQGRVFGITLDDGYANNHSHALPVLKRLGFSSTCYVVSRRIGQQNVWDASVGIDPSPLMDEQQLREWVAGGQEIGAHTQHHVHLNTLADAELNAELSGCRADLEAILHTPVQHFCYPYGEYEARHVEAVRRAGYVTATTTHRGRVHADDDAMELCRVPVLRTTVLPLLWWKMVSKYEDRRRPFAALSEHHGMAN